MNSRGLLTLIVFIAALLRFWNLGAWPVFMDEDIYTWGAHSLQSMGLAEAFRTAYWGKSPFPLYLQGLLGIASGDTLLAGRTLSAVSGCATTALCFFLGRRIGDERQGLVAAGLYALSPLAVLHERMALLDAPMTTCLLAGMLCSWESIEKRSWMWTALAFVAGGLAVQFKVPGVAAAAMPWLILLTYDGVTSKRIAIASVTSAGPILSYSALMLSPLGQGLAAQSAELRQSPSWELLGANLLTLQDTAVSYLPAGLWLVALAGAALLLYRRPRTAAVFLLSIVCLSLPWLILSRFTPSRYYLPSLPFVCSLAAVAMVAASGNAARNWRGGAGIAAAGISVMIAAFSGAASVRLVLDHAQAHFSGQDDWQYRSGWPSGYGYAEAARYIAENVEPGARVAYAIDIRHAVGMQLLWPPAAGVVSLGLVRLDESAALGESPGVYLVVDDGNKPSGRRLRWILDSQPRFREVARFHRPGAESGTYVLRSADSE